MSLWVDKYRPTSLTKLDFHLTQADHLKHLVDIGDFPHLLFYGPSGAGKKTRIMCLLRELYGPGVDKLKMETLNIQGPSKKIEIHTLNSNYHIEVNPSDADFHDRIVIQELIKNVAQTQQLDVAGQKEFKVVVLTEADRLSRFAQHALRRTMEKYAASCRLILCSNSISRVMPAIRSRCLAIRVPAPSNEQIEQILMQVATKEGLNIPKELLQKIIDCSERNLRRALLALEACKVKQYPFTSNQEVPLPDWQTYLKRTASEILYQQTPEKLLAVRERLYELIIHGIPSEEIFKGLLSQLVKNCDMALKREVVELAAHYDFQMNQGSKAIFHLEAFVAKFMSIYKKFMDETCAFAMDM